MALLSHYRAAMAKTSSGELGGFDRVFKYLILFVQALNISFFASSSVMPSDTHFSVLIQSE
jgi:hypothetical protein